MLRSGDLVSISAAALGTLSLRRKSCEGQHTHLESGSHWVITLVADESRGSRTVCSTEWVLKSFLLFFFNEQINMKSSTEGREEASLEEKETKHSPCLIASQTPPFLLTSVQAWGLRWNKTVARGAKPSTRGILASVATGGQWCAPSFTDLWS